MLGSGSRFEEEHRSAYVADHVAAIRVRDDVRQLDAALGGVVGADGSDLQPKVRDGPTFTRYPELDNRAGDVDWAASGRDEFRL